MNAITIQQQPAFTMNEMERVADAIAKGGLFGSKDPYAVLTLCMLAQAEGQHPAVVFRDYHIISGKPSKKAEAMQRDFLAAGGTIEWHQLQDECCDATFSHPQGGTVRISWDKARVKQAQLGGNAMHGKYPRQMLRSRVISEGVRTVYPGATSGLYETGEVQDIVAEQPMRNAASAKRVEAPKPDDARAKAEAWANSHIAAIEQAADNESIAVLNDGAGKALTKMRDAHPDLHAAIFEAADKRASLFGATGDQPAEADIFGAYNADNG